MAGVALRAQASRQAPQKNNGCGLGMRHTQGYFFKSVHGTHHPGGAVEKGAAGALDDRIPADMRFTL